MSTTIRDQALAQLNESGVINYIVSISECGEGWGGTMRLAVLLFLRNLPQFTEGPFWTLHAEVGNNLTEFRSDMGAYGDGSMQIVIDQATGRFYCDVDKFSPYMDARGAIGHLFGEVVPDYAGRVWRWLTGRGK